MGAIFMILLAVFMWLYFVVPKLEKYVDLATGLAMISSIFAICLT